jgi:hypothetical protein
MPEPNEAELLAYLQKHGESYDLAVLREHLVSHGQAPAAVDAAVRTYRAERQERSETRRRQTSGAGIAVRVTLTVILSLLTLAILLVGTCTGGYFFMMNSEFHSQAQAARQAALLFYPIVLGLFILLLWAVWRVGRAAGQGEDREDDDA